MFTEQILDDFLEQVQGIPTEAARDVGRRLMLGALELSSGGKCKVSTAQLMNYTGVTKPQLYYFANGMGSIWGYILKAFLFAEEYLSNAQREMMINIIKSLNFPDRLPFTLALPLLIDKSIPIRRQSWSRSYVAPHGEGFAFCTQGLVGLGEWRISNEDLIADDWEIALPDKFRKDGL